MKISLSKYSGFCMGVRNAILKIANEINSTDEDIYVYGPLIHNPQTVEVLEGRGLKTVKSLENIKNKQVAIRTHGITVEENRLIKNSASRTINLTCPRVARVQSVIKKYSGEGYFTIIIGDNDHPEVIGLMSYAQSGIFIISDINDIHNLPNAGKYVLVSQTTIDRELFKNLVDNLLKKYPNISVIDTICDSTKERQRDVYDGIKSGNDTLVVVGGKNSANTKRLAQIGMENGVKTFHVETENDIKEIDFADSKKIFVTAGASTPGWIINNVMERLFHIKYKKSNVFMKIIKIFLEFIVRTNLLSAIAALFFSLAALKFMGIELDFNYPIFSFLYIFSMYSINNYFEREYLKSINSYKYTIYEKFGIHLFAISILSMIISLVLSFQYNILTIIVILSSYIFGFVYSTNPVKHAVNKTGIDFFKKLYNSKIVAGFGWIIITVILPVLDREMNILSLTSLAFLIYTIIFLRRVLIDLIAFQGDLIIGRETLPLWLGIKNIRILSLFLSFIGIAALSLIIILNGNYIYLLFTLNIIYFLVLMNIITRLDYLISLKYELLVDLNFILMIAFYFLTSL